MFRQFLQPISVSAGDGILRFAEYFADFFKRHLFPDLQDNHFGLRRRQLLQRGLYKPPRFIVVEQGAVFGSGLDGALKPLSPLAAAGDFERFIADDLQKISPRVPRPGERLGVQCNADKGGLQRVFGIVQVTGEQRGVPHEPWGGQVEQLPERIATARPQLHGAAPHLFRE